MTSSGSLVTGTDFVTVGTKDIDAAVEFYGSALAIHHRYAPGAPPQAA